MTATKRPGANRARKSDRLLCPGSNPDEIRCDYACAPFDRVAREMEIKWGIDRLPELVSPETAERFGSAMAKMNAAHDANDPAQTAHRVTVAIKGLNFMDAEAERMGAPKASTEVWQFDLNGWVVGIHRDVADWPAVRAAHPHLHDTFSLREAAVALRDLRHPMVAAVKAAAPKAEIVSIGRPSLPDKFYKNGGDDIPW